MPRPPVADGSWLLPRNNGAEPTTSPLSSYLINSFHASAIPFCDVVMHPVVAYKCAMVTGEPGRKAMDQIDKVFEALQRSEFRRRIKLRKADWVMLKTKGLAAMMAHASEFIELRLAPAKPAKDGMQTPMRGHPVFTAQHATATCCRRCLSSWHNITAGHPLTEDEKNYIAAVLRRWLEAELNRARRDPNDGLQLTLDV